MNLLSEKDADILRNHLAAKQEVSLERRMGDHSVIARVVAATPVWEQPMIVQLRVESGPIEWTQNFRTVDEAMARYRASRQ